MFRSCAFCNAAFDGDGGPSGLGVGRRIAFDEWGGRLWVVCPRCSRWNLTPFDDRLERIEAVARSASQGRIAASTDQVALIRWERYDFVRVGKPPRVELATWRYGERLRNRQRERMKVVVPLTVAAIGLGIAANVAAGGGFGVGVWNVHRLVDGVYLGLMGRRKGSLEEPALWGPSGRAGGWRRSPGARHRPARADAALAPTGARACARDGRGRAGRGRGARAPVEGGRGNR